MSKITIATAVIAASLFTAAAYAGTCADGTESNSTGRGTCSHHGGENWRPAARQALYTVRDESGAAKL